MENYSNRCIPLSSAASAKLHFAMKYQQWISALITDARDHGCLERLLSMSDHTLGYFYSLGCEPTINAILNESEYSAAA